MTDCQHSESVGAYVLQALDEPALAEFVLHLDACDVCREEIAELQVVADNLPLVAPQVAPAPALRDRIMAVVESEAELLRAAGAGADRVPARAAPRRWRLPRLRLAPSLAAGAVACAAVVAVLVAGSGGADTRTVSAAVAPRGARASVKVTGERAELTVVGMPSPAAGKVYEVWLVRAGRAPQPTHALFGVRADGRAVVKIPERIVGADAVWVTAEPNSGSVVPTGQPVIKANLA
jgi:hypothetical protein